MLQRELIIVVIAILVVAACGSERVEQSSRASTASSPTLSECVGMFAASVHAHCTDVGPPPSGPGTAPSEDGIVRREGEGDDPLGLAEEVSLAPEPELRSPAIDTHCEPGALPAAIAAHQAAFRTCAGDRADPGTACSSAIHAPCPPGLNDAECAAAREAAVSLCATDVASL